MDWQGERYSLNNPVSSFEDWSAQGAGVFDILNQGLAPRFVFGGDSSAGWWTCRRGSLSMADAHCKSQMIGIEIGAPLNDALLKTACRIRRRGQSRLGPLMAMGGHALARRRSSAGGRRSRIWNRKDRPTQFGLATTTSSDGWRLSDAGDGDGALPEQSFGTGFE